MVSSHVNRKYCAALFDLDGVIVDTAKYHYLAWKSLAHELGFDFTQKDNERLKGVSRMRSLEILLEIGGMTLDDATKTRLAAKKNDEYVKYIEKLDASELLPGAKECLLHLQEKGVKTALGSASKNALLIIYNLKITHLFNVVIDGNKAWKAKPDSQVFLFGAQALDVSPSDCVVFEDAEAGIQAAKAAGMYAVGIGQPEVLFAADIVIPGLHAFDINSLF
ncbi:MAG: beta-phosphoglucomutase [Chloroflexota bacterium]